MVASRQICCIALCEEEASVIDEGGTATLKLSVPFCSTHFSLWTDPYSIGKDIGSVNFDRVHFSPMVEDDIRRRD
jgi:hypothetical protein